MRGVNSLEDIAWVKALVVEVVRDGGASVLNADDRLVAAMAEKAEGRIVYFSMHGGEGASDLVKAHIAAGGTAVVLQPGVRGDMIAIYDGEQYIPLLWTHLIPATLEGKALHNVANALAATAICYAQGIGVENIKQGLRTFTTSFFQAPGRLNVFDEYPFRVIVDYAHNPAAFRAMQELVTRLRPHHRRVIAVMSAPGDRRNVDIHEDGMLVAGMCDLLVLKEDDNHRGRKPGETIALLRAAAIEAGLRDDQIIAVPDEREATRYALSQGQTNDLVIVFADGITTVWKEVVYFGKSGAPIDM
jgi:cyanophycin synthetase